MIIPVYKPLGASSHQLAKKVGYLCDEKATHSGTLDPMAKGVLIVLTGSDRFDKMTYSKWEKTYSFQILWGVATDSSDLLGLLRPKKRQLSSYNQVLELRLAKTLERYIGTHHQVIPDFSAKRIGGTSYFERAKAGLAVPVTKQTIDILSLSLDETTSITAQEIIIYLKKNIKKVLGDFRQTQVLESWQKYLQQEHTPHDIFVMTAHTCICSRRTYIRGIVRDLSKQLAIPATTFSIIRTQNGKYGIADSICIL